MSTAPASSQTPAPDVSVRQVGGSADDLREVTIYGHTMLMYWWPVWAVGYLLALLTYFQGLPVQFVQKTPDQAVRVESTHKPAPGQTVESATTVETPRPPRDIEVLIHPSKSLGVIYTFVFLLVIVVTNISVRGVASLTTILAMIAAVLLFAYMGWWDDLLLTIGSLAMFMNLGFYVFFSTALLIVWALSIYVSDRLTYWKFRPGQMVHNEVFGGGARSHDTLGMSVHKLQDDLFRHWGLGLGSGDLRIVTTGANKAEYVIPNVPFIDHKLRRIQRLIAMKPDDEPERIVVGEAQ